MILYKNYIEIYRIIDIGILEFYVRRKLWQRKEKH